MSHSSSIDQEPDCGISRGSGGHKTPKEIQSKDLGKAIGNFEVHVHYTVHVTHMNRSEQK